MNITLTFKGRWSDNHVKSLVDKVNAVLEYKATSFKAESVSCGFVGRSNLQIDCEQSDLGLVQEVISRIIK